MILRIKNIFKKSMLLKMCKFYRYQIESIDTELSYPNDPSKCDPEKDKDLLKERDKYVNIVRVILGMIDDIERGLI